MAELGARCRQKQLQRFLESHRIEDAVLPNIGKGRKQLLRVYNIEDASDVEPSRINGIKGFGPTMQNTLLAWRASIEQRFRFDPNRGIDPEDLRQLEQELQQKRAESIRALMAGPQQLTRTLQQWDARALQCQTKLVDAAKRLAQAQVDVGALGYWHWRIEYLALLTLIAVFAPLIFWFWPRSLPAQSYILRRSGKGGPQMFYPDRFEPREPRILMSARPTSEGPSVMPHGPQETFGPLSRIPGSSNCNKCETGASQTARTIMKRTI